MRSKLILGGASTSIIALSIVAVVAFFMTKDAISDTALAGLNAVATNQHRHILTLLETYQGDLDTVSGDTHIRRSLRLFLVIGSQVGRFRLTQILTERAATGTNFHSFDLHNLHGKFVASSKPGNVGPSVYDATETVVIIEPGSSWSIKDVPSIRISTPIMFNEITIGYVTVHHYIDELNDIVTQNIGRGETGESLVLYRDSNGEIRYVTALRFDDDRDLYRPVIELDSNRIEPLSLGGISGMGTSFTDYRGGKVFGAYRYIKNAEIGLVAKMDEE
jgi:hypothetical protein